MPACSQIYLWMETLKYDALNKVVTKNNTTIEALLQPKLEELYCEYVPADLRKQIAEKMEAGAEAPAAEAAPAAE